MAKDDGGATAKDSGEQGQGPGTTWLRTVVDTWEPGRSELGGCGLPLLSAHELQLRTCTHTGRRTKGEAVGQGAVGAVCTVCTISPSPLKGPQK